MKKFPSIDQFRQVVRDVRSAHDYIGKTEDGSPSYQHTSPYPLVSFKGTVKLHGTNAAIVKYKNDDSVEFQSRERVLSLQQDNSGFMLAMSNKNLDFLFNSIAFNEYMAVYGEWCGQGIQKGVAVSQLPKMFVIFAVKVDDVWINPKGLQDNDQGIFNVTQFAEYEVDIDFNNPEAYQNKLKEATDIVEQQCPAGKFFGVDGVGEGIVWTGRYNDNFYMFKVKGEKHSVSKVKTLASVDVEMVESINEFVENTVTNQRLEQGISWLKENLKSVDQKSTGDFLRWVFNDIIKEETDTIVKNQLDPKKLGSPISSKARVWYFDYINSNM